MELRDVGYFQAVAEHGHLGRAAEALGLSQPALSKSLRRLEAAVRTKLVRRTPKGVELTAAGSVLLARSHRLRLAQDDVMREIVDLGDGRSGRLRIGGGPDSGEYLLPQACATLLKDAPKAQVKLTIETFETLLPALRRGELDLIVAGLPRSPHEDLAHEHVGDHEFAFYAAPGHRLASRRRIVLADLAQEQWALAPANVISRRWVMQAFEDCGLPAPRVTVETVTTALRLRIVASTGLVGFFWKHLVRQAAPALKLVELRVQGMTWRRRVSVTYRKNAYLSPLAVRFIETLKATHPKTAASA